MKKISLVMALVFDTVLNGKIGYNGLGGCIVYFPLIIFILGR